MAENPSGRSPSTSSTIDRSHEPSSPMGVGTAMYATSVLSVTSERLVPLAGSWICKLWACPKQCSIAPLLYQLRLFLLPLQTRLQLGRISVIYLHAYYSIIELRIFNKPLRVTSLIPILCKPRSVFLSRDSSVMRNTVSLQLCQRASSPARLDCP